jgi:hypothetical protein
MIAANGTRCGPLHGCLGSIHSDNVAAFANQVRSQKAHISGAATDIEDTHSRLYSCLSKKVPGEGCEDAGLKCEAV